MIFLSELKGKKRRQIIKERKEVKEQGLQIKLLPAEQIDEKLAKNFFQFYLSTIEKKYSFAYLTESFFCKLFERCREDLLIIVAEDSFSNMVAASPSLQSSHTIFGRYWGSHSNFKQLHFRAMLLSAHRGSYSKLYFKSRSWCPR